jgi:hypothetical protein
MAAGYRKSGKIEKWKSGKVEVEVESGKSRS